MWVANQDSLLPGMESETFSDPKTLELLKEEEDDFLGIASLSSDLETAGSSACLVNGILSDKFTGQNRSMDDWDQDVLLSNASLPEINPLLEMGGEMVDDFRQFLTDWENQVDAVNPSQVSTDLGSLYNPGEDVRCPSDDSFLIGNDEVVASATAVASPGPSTLAQQDMNSVLSTPPREDLDEEDEPDTPPTLATEPPATANDAPKMTLGKKTLAGIVISSGPGGHFETYEVIEAPDAESLLEKFETSGDCASQEKIMEAVNSHFSSSTRKFAPGKVPKIVSSQRIKESLPKEIVEKIKASSQKSKTIAIIEPINRNNKKADSNKLPTVASGSITSRFQEAGASLNRSKLRNIGIVNSKPPSPQQVQVNLDHDYCSLNKVNRRNRNFNHQQSKVDANPIRALPGSGAFTQGLQLAKKPIDTKPLIRIPSAPASLSKRIRIGQPQVISLAKPERKDQKGLASSTLPHLFAKAAASSIVFEMKRVSPTSTQSTLPSSSSSGANAPDLTDDSSSGSSRLEQRRDSDTKKDSGLESGEVSDASNNDLEEQLYSRLPSYITITQAPKLQEPKKIHSNEPEEDNSELYDRLPAYMTGRSSLEKELAEAKADADAESRGEKKSQADDKKAMRTIPIKCDSKSSSSPQKTNRNLRSLRKRDRSQSSSSSSSNSSNSSSSSSSSDDSEDDVQVPSPSKKRAKNKSSIESSPTKRTVAKASKMSPAKLSGEALSPRKATRSTRRRSRSPSTSPERYRSRSPGARRRTSRKRSYDRERFTRDRQKREQEQRHLQQEKQRQVEERRVVYVGRIAEGTTRADLRKRFQVFGPVEEISVHFRDRGDNYGFVTFKFKVDAYEAVEHGNDDPTYPKVDLCFGGRRTFCKEKYSDLDNVEPGDKNSSKSMDFDSLLKQARAVKATNKK